MTTTTAQSADGTTIAFTRTGTGPALILVDGALCHRQFGPSAAIAKQLAERFTVFTYDRRGRGESGNTRPYSPQREVEDLAAVVEAAGGSALVCGISSGAALALEAANAGVAIRKLALFEAPLIVDDKRPAIGPEYLQALERMIAEDRRSDAVRHFMKAVQVPAVFVALMWLMPSWSKLTASAPTLVHDVSIVEPFWRGRPLPAGRWASVTAPTLVMDGGKSPAWMRNAQKALAAAVPNAASRTLEGQTHMVNAKVLAGALTTFFA